jgi:hypothetical protein
MIDMAGGADDVGHLKISSRFKGSRVQDWDEVEL